MDDETYLKLLSLLDASPYHQRWTDQEVTDLIDKPIELMQYVMGGNDDGSLFFFATFATPEEKHIQEYLMTSRFPKEGFEGKGEDVWIIDFICMGGRADVACAFRILKNLLLSIGYKQCFWLRTETKRMGFHAVKE